MTAEAIYRQDGDVIDYTPAADVSAGEVIQLRDGRAGVAPVDIASGVLGCLQVCGIVRLLKTASICILDGGKVYWDHSANKAHFKAVNDRDFYVGAAVGDSLVDGTVDVALNVEPRYIIDLARDATISALAGTPAAGGFGYPVMLGGGTVLEITATNEAQKVDAMSVAGFAVGAKAIVEGAIRVISDGGSGAQDFSIGAASGTHATDFETVAEFVALHLDGNVTAINAESDDGTTDVAPTDTTKVYAEGSDVAKRVEFWMDFRNSSDVQIYIDGVLVLGATVFTLAAAAGPLFLIAHLEKTATTDVYKVCVDWLRARLAQN
jgi:predicted RecA/RadA family phage recombinase